MSVAQNLISYWRDSLIDAERMGLSGEVFNDPANYSKVNRVEIENGQINENTTWQIFSSVNNSKEEKEYSSGVTENNKLANSKEHLDEINKPLVDKEERQEESSTVNVLICPVLAVSQKSLNRQKSIVPLWIPAQITLNGSLLTNNETLPWLSRKLLEPTEAELTIGTLEEFNSFLVLQDKPPEDWNGFWHYCAEMLKEVTGMGCDDFRLDDYATLPEAFILLDSTIQGGARHILKVYDWLLEGGLSSNCLIRRYASLKNNSLTPLLTPRQQSNISLSHLGQMTGKHPLSISQREALCHFFKTGYGEILAVNGPPGTGKTTLLQSVVASLWVEKALKQDEPPIILATSTNNQAVTNIIDSFGKLNCDTESSLAGRWLPKIKSYGLYLPSKNKISSFQTADPQGYGFPATIQNKQYITEAEPYFLERCSSFAERPIIILKQAINFLHQQLVKTFKSLKASISSEELDIAAQEILDVELRYKAFQLATHYWEGRWLMEMQQTFRQKPDTIFPKKEDLIDRWSRYAMLTPCFVSTFYMAPKFFSTYENETFTPGLDLIDLLIVDEAGQVSPEVAGATFALAKQALVVGDTLQIEPVWSIPTSVDWGNLQKHFLLSSIAKKEQIEAEKKELDDKGLTASAGNVMKIAQRASCYQKYSEQRGMFLTEHRRCVDEIISYCNELCYEGKLEPMRDITDNPSYSPFPCMGYLHIPGKTRQISSSRQNEIEARQIAQWLNQQRQLLEDSYNKPIADILGIITPFSRQTELIQKELKQFRIGNITVGTVHRLQGAERNIIIFSSVYDSSFQGTFFFDRSVNMLNVAISRAKDSFLVFGDKRILSLEDQGTPSTLLAKHLFKNDYNCLGNIVLEEVSIFSSKTYLNVPFSQKDEAKSLGARWDSDKKKWYVPSGKDIRIFSDWLLTD